MRVFITLTFLFAYLMPMIYAQSTATVYVQDSNHAGEWGYFSTHFVGLKLDSGGSSHITFLGGDSADYDHVLSFSDEVQSTVFQPSDTKGTYITATGTYWIYLATQYSTVNDDWLEVRVVANSFSGTITSLYNNVAPYGWVYGWPPLGTHMMITNGENDTPTPPTTQAPPTNIKSWLIPLLIVIIVATIAIPSTIYLIRRRNAKKLAALTGNNTPDFSSSNHQDVNVQMHEVRV